jgi:hypothetical protein
LGPIRLEGMMHGIVIFIGALVVEWNSTFLIFSLIKEGTTEKVLKFIAHLKSIYNKNFGLFEQKMFFNPTERFKQ